MTNCICIYLQVLRLNFLPCRRHDCKLSLHWHVQVSGLRGWFRGHCAAHTQPHSSSSHRWPVGHNLLSPWPSHWHSPNENTKRESDILIHMLLSYCTKCLTCCSHGCTHSPSMISDLYQFKWEIFKYLKPFLQVLWSSFQPGPQLSSVSPFWQTHSQVVSSITLLGPQRARRPESSTSGCNMKGEQNW